MKMAHLDALLHVGLLLLQALLQPQLVQPLVICVDPELRVVACNQADNAQLL